MARATIESALRLLVHARNSHGRLRSVIRSEIHRDIAILRGAQESVGGA